MKISRNILTVTVVTICLVIFFAAFGGWAWTGLRVYELRDTLAQRITDREAARTRSEYSETVRLLVRDTTAERAELANITNIPAIDIVALLQEAASESGVEITFDAVTPGVLDIGTVKNVSALTAAVSSSDSFVRLYRFLVFVDSLPLPLIIDEVSLDREGSGGGGWMLRAKLIFYTEATQ